MKLWKAALVALWLSCLGVLAFRTRAVVAPGGAAPAQSPRSVLSRLADPRNPSHTGRDEWFGLYLQGTKVGYSHSTLRPAGAKWIFEDTLRWDLVAQGHARRVEMEQRGELAEDYSLLRVSFKLVSEGAKFELKAFTDGQEIKAKLSMGSSEQDLVIPVSGPLYLAGSLYPYLERMGLREGDRHWLLVFDPSTQGNTTLEVAVGGREEFDVGGARRKLYRVDQTLLGVTTTGWVDEKARLWREQTPEGLLLVRETEEGAQAGITADSPDVIELFSVPVARELPSPASLHELKLRISGLPADFGPLGDFRQTLQGESLVVKIEALPPEAGFRLPYRLGGQEENLKDEPLLPAGSPRLKDLAEKILGNGREPVQGAKLLTSWVYHNLEKENVVGIPSALEALETKRGDCNEHTMLLVALARAAGLPARPVAGLVYLDGRFYYHAWAELFVGRWVTADPTFGQIPADVTHLQLARGSLAAQTRITNVVGRIRLEIEDFR